MPTLIATNWDYLLWGNLTRGEPGGLLLTLMISLAAGLSASLLGLCGGVALAMGGTMLRKILSVAVAFLRAIPTLMLIFWAYFLLPILFGVDVPGVLTVIVALGLISGAYLSQSVLAGIEGIKQGQWAAGLSLGLTRWQALREVILPQALHMMLPSFVNQWITLIKDSSLAYIVSVAEFTFVATQINNREQIYPLEVFSCLGLGYFVLCCGVAYLGRRLERRWQYRSGAFKLGA